MALPAHSASLTRWRSAHFTYSFSRTKPMKKQRWQDQRFFLTDWYKYALFQIIGKHKKLSPGAKGYACAVLGLFGTKPMFPMNLCDLARHCGITERTQRKYRRELEDAKLFRFVTPPYWVPKSQAQATEIWFPTAKVTKWLRNHGLLTAKSDWVSRNDKPDAPLGNTDEMGTSQRPPEINTLGEALSPTAAMGSTPTTGKITPSLPKEAVGVAAAASPSGAASDGAPSAGASFWDEDTDETFWVNATEALPEDMHPSWLGARVKNIEGMTGTVVGFPVAESDERLDFHMLVRYEPTLKHEFLDWASIEHLDKLESDIEIAV
jgi:hypothetical protein